ncbi:MAG: hypothetical protein IJ516_05760 [Phascolarctobacterium sp.]|nr:hypothetical protein [Phascolarctobacterium sp.]
MENTKYENAKELVKNTVKIVIANHKEFGLTESDVAKDMALVVAQAIREATKE